VVLVTVYMVVGCMLLSTSMYTVLTVLYTVYLC